MSGDVEAMAEELRDFLKRQPHERLDPALHGLLMRTLERGWPDRSFDRVSDVQVVLDEAIEEISDDVSRRAARALFGDGDSRYLSVKSRGTEAGTIHGVSYDAYRRSGSGRLTGDLVLIADAISGCADRNSTGAAPGETPEPVDATPPSRGRRTLFAVGAAVLALTAGAVVIRATRSEEPVTASAVDDGTTMVTSSTAAPDTTTTTMEDEETDPPSSAAPTTDPVASTEGSRRELDDLLGCMAVGTINSSDSQALRAAAAIVDSGIAPSDACAVEPVSKRGEAYWQKLERNGRLDGGIIAYESDDGAFEVIGLNAGQWQSYIRVGGGDGSRSTTLGGMPSGELNRRGDLYQLELLGDAVLVGEDPEGTYYWMPNIANAVWEEDTSSSDPQLGVPTSSLYLSEGEFRVDFENGYMFQDTNAVISFELVPEDGRALDVDALAGGLISSIDGTAWFVDGEGKRWWVPDGRVWECVGGQNNHRLDQLRGFQIHTLDYGGVADCPMNAADVWPREGGLNLRLYCLDEFQGSQVSTDSNWSCHGLDGQVHAVDLTDVCRWQYGPAAIGSSDPGNAQSWYCENVDS